MYACMYICTYMYVHMYVRKGVRKYLYGWTNVRSYTRTGKDAVRYMRTSRLTDGWVSYFLLLSSNFLLLSSSYFLYLRFHVTEL